MSSPNSHSSQVRRFFLNLFLGKPGKAIFLIKERSKLVRQKRKHREYELSERLGHILGADEEMKDQENVGVCRRKLRKINPEEEKLPQ
jgi:hypothetical protein